MNKMKIWGVAALVVMATLLVSACFLLSDNDNETHEVKSIVIEGFPTVGDFEEYDSVTSILKVSDDLSVDCSIFDSIKENKTFIVSIIDTSGSTDYILYSWHFDGKNSVSFSNEDKIDFTVSITDIDSYEKSIQVSCQKFPLNAKLTIFIGFPVGESIAVYPDEYGEDTYETIVSNDGFVTFPYDGSSGSLFASVQYDISYELNGGDFSSDVPTKYIHGKVVELPNEDKFVKKGFVFSGLYDNEDLSGDQITQIGNDEHGSKTFFVKWERNAILFYFTDNFGYDGLSNKGEVVYAFDIYTANLGIWVAGEGDEIYAAFSSACKSFYGENVSIEIDGGKITQIDSVVSNIYIWGWNGTDWFDKTNGHFNTLDDVSGCSYIAIVHGACKEDKSEAPAITGNPVPSEEIWVYGDVTQHLSGDKIIFYIYDNFEYSGFVSDREDASNPNTLLVKGIWIAGYANYGESAGVAFQNALDRIGYKYSIKDNFITHINGFDSSYDGNYVQASWDGEKWDTEKWLGTTSVGSVQYMAIGHGEWDGGSVVPPLTTEIPSDTRWYY